MCVEKAIKWRRLRPHDAAAIEMRNSCTPLKFQRNCKQNGGVAEAPLEDDHVDDAVFKHRSGFVLFLHTLMNCVGIDYDYYPEVN